MKKIFYFLTLLLLSSSFSTKAQMPEPKEYDFLIFGVPQYILSNGLRVDFDIHKKNTPNWLIISPYYYFDRSSVDLLNLGGSEDYYDSYTYDQMFGFGMGIGRKTFLSKESVSKGFYLYYSATYKFFDIDGNNYIWFEYPGEDGFPYQRMDDIEYTMQIHSMGANATLGYQYQVFSALYIDLYIGFGVKYSYHYSPDHVTVKYNRGINDFGYTGTHVVGGIRIGIGL